MRKRGIIIWYSATRRIGTIIDLEHKRYFFHQGCITVGPAIIQVDCRVTFLPDEEAAKNDPSKLPVARQIEVLTDGVEVQR